MKKFVSVILTMCLTCIMCVTGQPMSVRADTSEPFAINECQDISQIDTTKIGSYAKIAQEIIDEGKGSPYYNKNYAFTLSKPAYVAVCVYSVVATDYSNLGNIVYSVTSAPSGMAPVTGSSVNTVSKKSTSTQYLLLNPGTYYVHVELADDSCQSEACGYFKIGVLAQYLDVTMGNITKGVASPVTPNATSAPATGAFTATQRELWYSFYLAQNSYVNINTMTDNAWHKDIGKIVAGACATTLMDGNGKEYAFWNIPQQYGKEYTKAGIYLEKGTYYVRILGNNYYAFNNADLNAIDYDNGGIENKLYEGNSVTKGAIRCGGSVQLSVTASVAPPITLKAPSNLKASRLSNTSFKCTWNKVTGAEGYIIKYSTSAAFSKSKTKTATIAASSNACTISQGVKSGSKYYVKIYAFRKGYNNKQVNSAEIRATVNLTAPEVRISKPTGLKTSNITDKHCTFSYKSVKNAGGYQVQLSKVKTFKGAKIQSNDKYTVFAMNTLDKNTVYYWRVRAWRYKNSNKNTKVYSAWSSTAKVTTAGIASPTGVTVSNAKGYKALVKFKGVKGAEAYQIYISTDKNFKKGVIKSGNIKKTSYTSKKLTKGKTYYVKVRAWKYTNKKAKKTANSSWVTKTVKITK